MSSPSPLALPQPFAVGSRVIVRFTHAPAGLSTVTGTLASVDALGILLTEARSSAGGALVATFIPWHGIGYMEPDASAPQA